MKITATNIDDIIRAEKRKRIENLKKGKGFGFLWGKKEFYILKEFYDACCPCVHGWFCLCGEKSEQYPELKEEDGEKGFTFMGIKHYWNMKKRGFEVLEF